MAGDAAHDEYIRCLLAAESSLRGYILAHVRDFDLAEDLLQGTAVALWRKFAGYDRSRPFLAWAIGMARNEIRKEIRASAQATTVFDSELAERLAECYVTLESELSERRRALRLCMERLPRSMRSAVGLRYEDGLDLGAIGARLGRTLAAVKVLLHRARLALEKCIRSRLRAGEA